MTEPSKERIAAALALAEATDAYERVVDDISLPDEPESKALARALYAYRATATKKLRTRAEVDAEIVGLVRHRLGGGPYNSAAICMDLVKLCAEPVTDDAPEPLCTVHGNVEHGREAEELRSGIEELIREDAVVGSVQLQRLLDNVDARDSLAFSERAADAPEPPEVSDGAMVLHLQLTQARSKIAELESELDAIRGRADSLQGLADSAKALNDTLRDDNERFAEELLEARKPCERRHLTEAEEALCEYAEERARPVYILNWPLLSDLINTVRDERRQQTKTMGGAEAAAMRSEEHRAPASAAPPAEPSGSSIFPEDDDDPAPERCSCEEALKLRRIVEIERQTSRELAQKIRDAIEVLS